MFVHKKYSQFLLTRQAKRLSVIGLIIFLICHSALHSMENNGRGTKAIAMANAFAAVSDNSWSVNYNPAGLLQIKQIECSAFIVPYQFGMSELRTTAFAITLPFSFSTVAFKAEQFGFDLYRETEFGAAFSVKLDQNIYGGLALNLCRLDIARYGSARHITFNVGLLGYILRNVKIGFCLNNITGTTMGRQSEKIPQICTLGVCWSLLDDLLMSVEMEKDIRFPASIKWGVEQKVFDVLAFRAGVSNNPGKYSTGIAVKYSSLEFGYAGYSHPDLGWTHQIDLSFRLDG
jgi:hypothetical protein